MKIPKLKEYSQIPAMQFLKEYDIKLYYEDLLTRYKELEKPCTHQKPPHADPLHLYFIHNTRHFSLLKEAIKYQVFIDKLLIIISHEFLLANERIIKIPLSKLCHYFNLLDTKKNKDNLRVNIKRVINFLIEREFIASLIVKNSIITIELNEIYYQELIEKPIKTRVSIKLFDIKGDEENIYKIARVVSFYKQNIKKEINKNSLLQYISDNKESRKKASLDMALSKLDIKFTIAIYE